MQADDARWAEGGPAIEVRDLRKAFTHRKPGSRWFLRGDREETEVLSGLTFDIGRGETVGYIGRNGAGKSTTIKILTGLMHPDSGSVRLHGVDPHRNRQATARLIGAVFGQRSQLWWDLPARESFRILGRMHRIGDRELAARLDVLDEVFDLNSIWHTPVRHLSLGQRVRCNLVAAVLHRPRVLFLDEPTIGLDLLTKDAFREYLRLLREEHGTTVLLTTHDIAEMERTCDRVIILDRGTICFDGHLSDLPKLLQDEVFIRVVLLADPGDVTLSTAVLAERDGQQLRLRVLPGVPPAEALTEAAQKLAPRSVELENATLEAVIRAAYRS